MMTHWSKMAVLSAEASQVIWLRSLLLAAGGARAQREMALMVTEKWQAGVEAGTRLMLGGSLDGALGTYRTAVRKNVRRLGRR